MGTFLGLGQLVSGPADDDFGPMLDKVLNELLEVQRHRTALHKTHVVDPEGALQLRVLVEVIEHHAGHGIALEVVDDAHSVAVRLVAHIRNTLNLLVVNERGGLLNHRGLVHHIGNFGNNDLFLAGFAGFEACFCPHNYATPTGFEGLLNALIAVDDAARGEVRSRDVLHQLGHRDIRVFEVGNDAAHYLGQVVRGHVGGHAHGDSRSAVHQQIGKLGGHHARLFQRVVKVGLEVNRVLVEVVEHLIGDALEAGLGVAHSGRRIAIDGTKVALTVYQRIAQAPVLGHAYHRIVHRCVAMRVVFTQDLTHDAGALFVGFVVAHAQLTHAVEHAAMHGLQAVAHIGQRPGDDDRHRVVDVRAPHLVFDVYRNDFFAFRH